MHLGDPFQVFQGTFVNSWACRLPDNDVIRDGATGPRQSSPTALGAYREGVGMSDFDNIAAAIEGQPYLTEKAMCIPSL